MLLFLVVCCSVLYLCNMIFRTGRNSQVETIGRRPACSDQLLHSVKNGTDNFKIFCNNYLANQIHFAKFVSTILTSTKSHLSRLLAAKPSFTFIK